MDALPAPTEAVCPPATPTEEAPRPVAQASGRKIHGDSFLTRLTEEQWSDLQHWLFRAGLTYARVAQLMRERHKVKVSNGQLNRLWQQETARRLRADTNLARLREASISAREILATARAVAPDLGEAALAGVSQLAFEASLREKPDVKALCQLTRLLLEAERQKVAGRHADTASAALALEREKFETLVAAKVLDESLRQAAQEIAARNVPRAEQIAAMRQALFADVDAFQAATPLALPQ